MVPVRTGLKSLILQNNAGQLISRSVWREKTSCSEPQFEETAILIKTMHIVWYEYDEDLIVKASVEIN